MPWKVAIFHIQNAIKQRLWTELGTWNLVNIFFRGSSNGCPLINETDFESV